MTEEEIHKICKQYVIKNYTINDDMSIDVDGNVDFYEKKLEKLPLRFRKVSGWFDCGGNQLTTLEGCPIEVGDNFYCDRNQLVSLKDCPVKVGIDFNCCNNKLTSLQNSPLEVQNKFYCDKNQLASLEDGPKFVKNEFSCTNNPIYEEFKSKFNCDYNLYRKYINRQKVLKCILND